MVIELENTLYIVVPCYNEETVLAVTAERLRGKIKALMSAGKISDGSRIVFVDDGSRDGTWGIIEGLCAGDSLFAGIRLSRNQGHQHALLAGLMAVRNDADMAISIDADLQDDIDAIDKMVMEYESGCDIVYGVRKNRKKDGFFKRVSAKRYYKLLRSLGCDIVPGHADCRLMSSRAMAALSEYSEQRMFLRGIVPLLGFKTAIVEYERDARRGGKSKYPLKRMLSLAFDGLTALSLRPLRIVTAVGVVMLLAAAALLIWLLVSLITGRQADGWEIVMVSVWAVGGIVTLSLGVVGEYVGRAYMEAKRRPRYSIDRTAGFGV
jgi:glycosyltransferase involved in cell wall biosynthesis